MELTKLSNGSIEATTEMVTSMKRIYTKEQAVKELSVIQKKMIELQAIISEFDKL